MTPISKTITRLTVLSALLLLGIGASADGATANDGCLGAPDGIAPSGQHWYYRIDREQRRKCWYLHAMTLNRAAGRGAAVQTPPPGSIAALPTMQVASAEQAAAVSSNHGNDGAQSEQAPHVTMLAVKPVPALLSDATSASRGAPTPETARNNSNGPPDGHIMPWEAEDSASVRSTVNAPDNALAVADNGNIGAAQTPQGRLFFFLALAVGLAAALSSLLTKAVRRARNPRCSDHPDDLYRRYYPAAEANDEELPRQELTVRGGARQAIVPDQGQLETGSRRPLPRAEILSVPPRRRWAA